MSALKQSLLGGAIVLVAIILHIVAPVETQPMPVQASQPSSEKYDGDCTGAETVGRCADKPFDHSNCQYPDRWSNPADGCDNSDPANPECIKGFSTQEGEAQCIAEAVERYQSAQPEINLNEYQGK